MSDLATQRLLERYLAGELGEPANQGLEARLAAEPALARRLEDLRAEDARILAALPPDEVAREIGRRQHLAQAGARAGGRKSSLHSLWWLLPAPLAVAALLVLRPAPGPLTDGGQQRPRDLEATRTKGLEPHLRIYLGGSPEPVVLRDGAQVKPHDVVQVAVVAPGRLWAAVVSIDAQGGATLHAAPSAVGLGEVRLPRAFELDGSPGFERFFLVISGAPFEAQPVLAAAQALAHDPSAARSQPLALPAGLSQSALLLDKVQP